MIADADLQPHQVLIEPWTERRFFGILQFNDALAMPLHDSKLRRNAMKNAESRPLAIGHTRNIGLYFHIAAGTKPTATPHRIANNALRLKFKNAPNMGAPFKCRPSYPDVTTTRTRCGTIQGFVKA